MRWQQLIEEIYRRMYREYEAILEGLTTDELNRRPSPGANPVGWILWHTARGLDRTVGDVILGEQLWVKDGWHARFNLPPDYLDTDSDDDGILDGVDPSLECGGCDGIGCIYLPLVLKQPQGE